MEIVAIISIAAVLTWFILAYKKTSLFGRHTHDDDNEKQK